MQAVVIPLEGPELRLSLPVRGTPHSGFHSPHFDDAAVIRAILNAFFVAGARASNGTTPW